MDAPPVLTPERIDAMLSIMAEVCLVSVVESGQRQKAADDVDEFERSGRTLQRACRNLRQTIAMKQRHDREQARKADEAHKRAEGARAEAERAKRDAVGAKRGRVLRHFERVLWDEYEDDEAHDWLDDLDARITDLSEDDPAFLDTPVETLIQRLSDDIGLGEAEEAAEVDAPPDDPPVAAAPSAPPPDLPPEPEPAAEAPPEVLAPPEPPDPPPEPPPEPPPKPYIPPWEHLRPGQIMPGGSGW